MSIRQGRGHPGEAQCVGAGEHSGRPFLGLPAIEKVELLDENSIRRLHLKMFDSTWSWAGTFRTTDKSIGVAAEKVAMRLMQRVEHALSARQRNFPARRAGHLFHHELVSIHPFANGNGRHACLMADILGLRLDRPAFTWSVGEDLVKPGTARQRYLEALCAVDKGDTAQLLAFARS